jgi:hypothetical protein
VCFLESAGARHEAVERRIGLPPVALADLSEDGVVEPFAFDVVEGRVRLSAQRYDGGIARVSLCAHNTTEAPAQSARSEALTRSLLSTHLLLEIEGGRFLSLIDPPEYAAAAAMTCANVNTFPVLAADDDTALLGATIMLPDHPQLAPESRVAMYDGTEIEEALLLHVLALSDGERAEIEAGDPAVAEMVRRAAAAGPRDLQGLHGRVTVSDPAAEAVPGETEIVVGGVTLRRGARVRLCPGVEHHAQDHLLDGRAATVERIYIDYEDHVHLGVTVEDDPGQELMRDIGRYLFFKPEEVELL